MKLSILLIIAILTEKVAVNTVVVEDCGPEGSFSIAGSSTVQPVAEKWAEAYTAECPDVTITVEGGGSSQVISQVEGPLGLAFPRRQMVNEHLRHQCLARVTV